MKPIVEGMGLKWNDQLEKMKKHPVLGPEVSPLSGIPSAGGPQTMVCLPETRLQFWMAIINSLKVKESAEAIVTKAEALVNKDEVRNEVRTESVISENAIFVALRLRLRAYPPPVGTPPGAAAHQTGAPQ